MEFIEIKKEITTQLADQQTAAALLATTFKGLSEPNMRQAIMEGMMRGFTFKNFLQKDVYAIPYSGAYNLVTSIDWCRKIGMRSGIIGVSEPSYETEDEGKPISCTITVKRRVGQDVGEFTAKVYFSEYTTGKNLWASKPRSMIAKVAEMHALRKACPEELGKSYVEEEMQREDRTIHADAITPEACRAELEKATTLAELRDAWAKVPQAFANDLEPRKNELKAKLMPQPSAPETPAQPAEAATHTISDTPPDLV